MPNKRPMKPVRAAVLVALPLLLCLVLLLALYRLQVLGADGYLEQSRSTVLRRETVPAARGKLLDRYGRVLASDRVSYDLAIDRPRLVEGGDPNGVLLELIACVGQANLPYNDSLPLSADAPFAYTEMSSSQKHWLDRYTAHFKLGESPTAAELMDWFRSHYEIPADFSAADARRAAGVRYELELRALFAMTDYVFAADLDVDTIAAVLERGYPGVRVASGSVREYPTPYAAHLLGTVGKMDAAESELYGAKGYPLDASVGKNGAELAFESYLHGRDGERVTVRSAAGEILDSYYTQEPQPGGDVTLTIDLGCQQAAEEALASEIAALNRQRLRETKPGEEPQLARSGAVAVTQVGTGEILALASYPSFDLSRYRQDYTALAADPDAPLYHRAIQGVYAPGSTFKVVTAAAGLSEGVITPETTIYDKGIIDEYDGYSFTCWAYPGSHGSIAVRQALQMSCNYFFYIVGRSLGIDTLERYAAAFGLGQPTGIELREEKTGVLASRDYKQEAVGEDWYTGDTLQASIGQSYHLFTPLQLSGYAATIAADGARYATHLLRSVSSDDPETAVYAVEPKLLSRVEADPETFSALKEGMLMASRYGSASYVFGNYGVEVCSKTGTAQVGDGAVNNAVFIAFAPKEQPEIAVSVVVESGANGYSLAEVARDIFDWYFSREEPDQVIPEGELIP